jgi:ribonuclease Y
MDPIIIGGVVIALGLGVVIGRIASRSGLKSIETNARKQADKIVSDAKREADNLRKDKELEAKEKFLKLKSDFDREVGNRKKKVEDAERALKQSEQSISQKKKENEKRKKENESIRQGLNDQLEIVNKKQQELEKQNDAYVAKLESVANLSATDAKQELIESLKEEAKTKALAQVKDIVDDAKQKANKEAKKIIVQTIQRTAAEHTIENTVSVFNLESDELKGQIIGREGRNIRALEAATGVELIVDDTPEALVISGFDPVRREVARLSLQRLVTDGRIHPARIEEVVAKTKKQMEEHIVEIGERSVIEVGVNGLAPELVKMVGRMRFRSSYGQNLLKHSKEVAHLCATMAAELKLSPKLAKRAGLLHDIGKVPEEESEVPHAILGMKLAEKYGEHPAVCNAIGAHHDEIEMEYVISPIVQACDAISGSRPGARREIRENYLQRLRDLENLALDHKGVSKAYAIQAGRELRVIVESEKVSDKEADELSFQISEKIQSDMQYPGQIKVTVIREKRAVSFAK